MRRFWKLALLLAIAAQLAAYSACLREKFLSTKGEALTLWQFRGKKLVVTFWATWCPWCKKELSELKILKKRFGDDINIIAFSVDRDREALYRFIRERGSEFPFILAISTPRIRYCFGGIRGIPATFILDEKLTIVQRFIGFVSIDRLERELD